MGLGNYRLLRNNHNMQHQAKGFTLIETLIALAIYIAVIATLSAVNRNAMVALSETQAQTFGRRALKNIIAEHRQQYELGQFAAHSGHYKGTYRMAHTIYQWQMDIALNQNHLGRVINAAIYAPEDSKIQSTQSDLSEESPVEPLARIITVW